jgi:HK97 gp10 family phage protein
MTDAVDTSKLYAQLDRISDINQVSSIRPGAEVILRHAQENAPVDTGFLRDSGQIVEESDGVAVEFTADYAAAVEYGTSKMAAQPYLRPAIDEYEKEILSVVADKVQEEVKAKI